MLLGLTCLESPFDIAAFHARLQKKIAYLVHRGNSNFIKVETSSMDKRNSESLPIGKNFKFLHKNNNDSMACRAERLRVNRERGKETPKRPFLSSEAR